MTAGTATIVRDLGPADWPEVARSYAEGIATGNATFETSAPSWAAWNRTHLRDHRAVAVIDDRVVGWVALAPVSTRSCYAGVVTVSVYVALDWRRQGIGSALLEAVVARSERRGDLDAPGRRLSREPGESGALRAVWLSNRRPPGAPRKA